MRESPGSLGFTFVVLVGRQFSSVQVQVSSEKGESEWISCESTAEK